MSSAVYTVSEWRPSDAQTFEEAKKALTGQLRSNDEGYLLPGAHHDGTVLHNVICALDPDTKPEQIHKLFNPAWGEGISVVRLQDIDVSRMLQTSESRKAALKALSGNIKNELVDSRISVGPQLAGEGNHDAEDDEWECGFDGEFAMAGLFSAMEDRAPAHQTRTARLGTTRGHPAHYLVVRAGAGRAAEEFHGKLVEQLTKGSSIEEALSTIAKDLKVEGGSDGLLKRLVSCGRRNRARLILKVANAFGIQAELMTSLDHGSHPNHATKQMAALDVDTVTNIFERSGVASGETGRNNYMAYFAGTTAPKSSQGVVICSNVAEGFILFRPPTNATEGASIRSLTTMTIQNTTYGSIPYTSEMLVRDNVLVKEIEELHIQQLKSRPVQHEAAQASELASVHPDAEWIDQHFIWHTPNSNRRRQASQREDADLSMIMSRFEPPSLWGTYAPHGYASWGHTMAIHELSTLRLRPELVLLAGSELAKLRGAARAVSSQLNIRSVSVQ